VDKPALGFIALKSLKRGPLEADAALAEIRRIYFNTTRQTIDNDLAHAIELLKGLPSDEFRERATVFMHGLSEMQREWAAADKRKGGRRASGKTAKTQGGKRGKGGKGGSPAKSGTGNPKPTGAPPEPDDE
jgi:hypothetical protein